MRNKIKNTLHLKYDIHQSRVKMKLKKLKFDWQPNEIRIHLTI